LFEALTDDGLAAGLYNTGTHKEALSPELGVPHAVLVFLQVMEFRFGFLSCFRARGKVPSRLDKDLLHVSLIQVRPPSDALLPNLLFIGSKEVFAELGDVFPCMVEVDDDDGPREVQIREILDPLRPISENDNPPRAQQSPAHRLPIDTPAKRFGRLNGAHEGG
jgi:hypothetical protein